MRVPGVNRLHAAPASCAGCYRNCHDGACSQRAAFGDGNDYAAAQPDDDSHRGSDANADTNPGPAGWARYAAA